MISSFFFFFVWCKSWRGKRFLYEYLIVYRKNVVVSPACISPLLFFSSNYINAFTNIHDVCNFSIYKACKKKKKKILVFLFIRSVLTFNYLLSTNFFTIPYSISNRSHSLAPRFSSSLHSSPNIFATSETFLLEYRANSKMVR